jgi:hypothetical protein
MAAGNSNYQRGTMGVDGHKKTFGGFMGMTVYGGAALALLIIFPTLVFAVKMGWLPSLIVTVILGFVFGAALKLKGGWYAGVVAAAIPLAIASALIAAIHG